jgi:hypothetical protein
MNFTGQHVLIIGDSQADGIDGPLGRLLTSLGATVTSSVHTGMSLAQGATLGVQSADIAIVSFGGNNPPVTYSRATAQMDALLALLPGARVYWMTVLPSTNPELQPNRARMALWQKRHLPTKGVGVIDGARLASGLPRAGDPHLTASGYASLAGRLLTALQRTATPLSGWFLPVLAGAAIGIGVAYSRTRNRALRGIYDDEDDGPYEADPPFDENIPRRTFSTNPITEIKDTASEQKVGPKPRGLWYECGDEWHQWLKYEMPHWLADANHRYELKLDYSKMKVIRNERELDAFHDKYKTSEPGGYGRRGIDWPRVAREYDGVEICPYVVSRRMSPVDWYYGWDVASGCVWRKRAVLAIREVPMPPKEN